MKLEEMLNELRKDKSLEFEFDFADGGRGGRIYIEPRFTRDDGNTLWDAIMVSLPESKKSNPLVVTGFMLNTEYYLIEKGIKFKDMEEGKKYTVYKQPNGIIYEKVDGLLYLSTIGDNSDLTMKQLASMRFEEINK